MRRHVNGRLVLGAVWGMAVLRRHFLFVSSRLNFQPYGESSALLHAQILTDVWPPARVNEASYGRLDVSSEIAGLVRRKRDYR